MDSQLIQVRDNIIRSVAMVFLRQAVIFCGGYFGFRIFADGNVVEQVALGLLTFGVVGYGWVKAWRDKRKAIELAERAPNAAVVK